MARSWLCPGEYEKESGEGSLDIRNVAVIICLEGKVIHGVVKMEREKECEPGVKKIIIK